MKELSRQTALLHTLTGQTVTLIICKIQYYDGSTEVQMSLNGTAGTTVRMDSEGATLIAAAIIAAEMATESNEDQDQE